jgi:predicted GNAT family acetyltransferase
VFRNRVIFIFFSALLLFPIASNSEAIQWDLLIQANVENSPLYSGDRPIVSGIIVDHASKPVPKATVNVKSGSMSIFTTTSQSGEFMAELGKQERIPGNYVVNISATSLEGKEGIASIQFQVKGELSPTAVNQQKLSTPEAKKYLESSPDEFDRNPIGFMLYNYYQKLYQEYLEDEKIKERLDQEKALREEQKEIENEFRAKAIEEFQPGMGIFSGPQYENYVNSLDDAVRDTVVEHLNFTKNLVEEAKDLRNEILENGGTAEEAQLAYLEKITTSRAMIENLGSNSDDHEEVNSEKILENNEDTKNSPNPETEESVTNETTAESPIKLDVDGVSVEVELNESVFLVNVNGKILEFLVEGTKLTLVNGSD